MPLMYRKRTLAVAAEGTYGTLESLVAADVYKFQDPVLKYKINVEAREKNTGDLGSDTNVPSDASTSLTMKNHMHGDGSTGDPAWAGELFPCVGMPTNASNSYRTSSTTTSWAGLSAALNRDGKRRTMRGGMGNLKITCQAGKPFMNDWSFVGAYNANPTATSQLASVTFEEVVPPKFAGSARFTLDSSTTVSTKIKQAVIDLGTNPFAREDPNGIGGYSGGWLQNILPTLTIDPEAVAVGTKDWQAIMDAGTEVTAIFVAGTATGNICTITMTNLQQNAASDDQERNGMLVDGLGFQCNGTVTIAFS